MDQRSLHVTISIRPSKYMCIIGQFNMNFMAFNAPKSFQIKRRIILVNSLELLDPQMEDIAIFI
jgi:hypothetical protein